jgi:hypothetical protein
VEKIGAFKRKEEKEEFNKGWKDFLVRWSE